MEFILFYEFESRHDAQLQFQLNTLLVNSWIENLNAYPYTIYIHSPNCFWHITLILNAVWSGGHLVVYFVWCMRKISISSTTISSPLETMAIMKFIQTLLKNWIYRVRMRSKSNEYKQKIESSNMNYKAWIDNATNSQMQI